MCNLECYKTCSFKNVEGDKVYYEIHITVDNSDRDKFISICENNNIKWIDIDMGELPNQLMTSIKHSENIDLEKARLKDLFSTVKIIRFKIEATTNHPSAFKNEIKGYYETHLEIDSELSIDGIEEILYASQNVKKRKLRLLTCRTHGDLSNHHRVLNSCKSKLGEENIKSSITEFCIEDSNLNLDYEWLNK